VGVSRVAEYCGNGRAGLNSRANTKPCEVNIEDSRGREGRVVFSFQKPTEML